jgi:hypothetical protein
MKNKLIDYHYEWLESGRIPLIGLCNTLEHINSKYKEELKMFTPNVMNYVKLMESNESTLFWASNLPRVSSEEDLHFKYTELRQTIVLFICAMCDEL